MKQGDYLDGLLGYQLQRAYLTMAEDARETLAPWGLTPAKLTALLLVRANPGCDQTALGRALSVNRSSAMKLVNYLAERGLIERRPGRDLRSNSLHLLAEGEAQVDAMLAGMRESDRHMSERLTEAERATLIALLGRVGPGRKSRARSAGS